MARCLGATVCAEKIINSLILFHMLLKIFGMPNRQTKLLIAIKAAIVAFIAFYALEGYESASSRTLQDNQHIQLIVSYPLVQMPGAKLTDLPDTVHYYYNDNYVAVALPVRRSIENSERILQQSISYSWFIYKKGGSYGYWFDSSDAGSSKKLKVDSILFNRGYATKFDISSDTLVGKNVDKKTGIIEEKYVPKRNYGEYYFDSLFYYYSPGMRYLKYSLSANLDSLKQMKLYKVRLCYNDRYSPSQGVIIPRRAFSFEIRELPFKDDGFANLINRVKKMEE